jgi:hypothetical protein
VPVGIRPITDPLTSELFGSRLAQEPGFYENTSLQPLALVKKSGFFGLDA